MVPVVYEIDPDADTIFILNQPCTDFAPWPLSSGDIGSVGNEESISKSDSAFRQGPASEKSSAPDKSSNGENGDASYHYLVSSRHLILASPWFKRALTKETWRESERKEPDGRFQITAESWDSEALLIIFRIIHLRNNQVPHNVSLEMIAKIAVLVDYYELNEALGLYETVWMDRLDDEELPDTYCRDVMLWIWVSSVFDRRFRLRDAMEIAIKNATEPIGSLGLPISAIILDKSNAERNKAIGTVIRGVHGLLDKYRDKNYVCPKQKSVSFQCGSFLLGALTRRLDQLNILTPQPESPFLELNLTTLAMKLPETPTPKWIVPSPVRYLGKPPEYTSHDCRLMDAINVFVREAYNSMDSQVVIKKGKSTDTNE